MKNLVCAAAFAFAFATPVLAHQGFESPAEVIHDTPEWKGERFADARPKVADGILDRMKLVTLEEAWAVLRNENYKHQYDGEWKTIAHDPRILWPDTMSIAADGYLYFTANQLHRQAQFHEGRDLREKPYTLFRTKIDAGPVLLK